MYTVRCLLGLAVWMQISCSEDALNDSGFEAGDAFTDSNIRVVMLDTMTVETSTMKFDSIITSRASRMLIGKYTDPVFGEIKSATYLQLLPESYTIDTEAEYDSLAIYLRYDGYYYNDTLKQNSIYINELSENLRPENGDDFYNTNQIAFSEDSLGSISFSPRPLQTDSLEIRLSDSLGLALFEGFQNQLITNSDEFTDYLKGLTLRADEEDNGSVIGFSLTSSLVRLYFSTAEENDRIQEYIDFNIDTVSSPLPFYNQIEAEAPDAYLDTLTDQEVNLSSSDSGDQSFIQSGIGIATRIQFPYIKSVFDIPGEGTLLDAILKIRPSQGSYDDRLLLRDTLAVYVVDENNDLTEQLATLAILNRENQEFNDIYYEVALGSYLEELLVTDRVTDEALILLPEDYNATVDRFVLNGNTDSTNQTSLELTYAIYDEVE